MTKRQLWRLVNRMERYHDKAIEMIWAIKESDHPLAPEVIAAIEEQGILVTTCWHSRVAEVLGIPFEDCEGALKS